MAQQNSLPTVCIVGRTNVGKSTLFNALVGKRTAVVKDQAGVTRDRYYELVTRHDFPFTLIDTGALVGEEDLVLHEAVRQQTALAMQQSDLIIVVFDGLHGLHPLDSEVVDLVRQMEKPTIYVANKCEKPSAALTSAELYSLGVEEIIPLSAAHRRGIRDLLSKMEELAGSSGLRGELALMRAARALAAYEGDTVVTVDHLKRMAAPALRHRLRRNPLDDSGSGTRVARAVDEVFAAHSK
jgi:small GTP-binding protein